MLRAKGAALGHLPQLHVGGVSLGGVDRVQVRVPRPQRTPIVPPPIVTHSTATHVHRN